MQPDVGPLSATTFGWLLAAVLTGGIIILSTHEEGLTAKQIALVLLGCTAALLLGAKALYLIETLGRWDNGALYSQQVRLPGGMIALLVFTAWLPRAPGAGRWRLADTIAPALGLLILGTRIGCFLQGCCYGRPSALPWALSFPRGSEAYVWQVAQGMVSAAAAHSLPVQPLQLYFAIAGAFMFLALAEYQPHKRYEGEVALLFAAAYLWSTWLLEHLRAQPHLLTQQFTLAACIAVTCILVFVEARRRMRAAGGAPSRPAENI